MAPVPAPAKALVTGANGYIAAWVVRRLLEEGYSVLGTVRSSSKGEYLKKLFAVHGDRFDVAVVEDMSKPGAFDDVVRDVQLVEHTASPFHMKVESPSDVIDPAVRGTVGILESVKRFGTSVRRVVITSSTAAVHYPVTEYTLFDESYWNEPEIKEVEDKGAACSPLVIYRASKTLAEKAAWEFMKQNSPAWDLVTLNPPLVFGPPIHEVTSLDALNTSMQRMYDVLVKGMMNDVDMKEQGFAWVDVRDLSRAHVLAAQKEEASGNRIIVSAGMFFWQDFVDAAVDNGDRPATGGHYGATKGKTQDLTINGSKSVKLLGMKYHEMKDTIRDIMSYFKGFSA